MKYLICVTIIVGLGLYFNKNTKHSEFKPLTYKAEAKPSFEVTATMYYAEAAQCDKDPLVTAGMFKINPNRASDLKWLALSRDLLKRWGGVFNYGDMVQLEGTGSKDGVYMVADCMNKRYKHRIDILETKGEKFYKFDQVKITKL